MTATWPKIKIFKIQDGGVWFQWHFVRRSGMACRQGLHDKNCNFFKIQDNGRPSSWKSLNRHMSVKNCPISMKFSTLQQLVNPIAVTWPKIEIFEIKDGGDRHLENHFCDITHRRFSDFGKILCRLACRQRPHDKNCKFLKSKMADGRHFENR